VKKSISILLLLISFSFIVEAQRPQGQGGGNRGPSVGRVYGKLLEGSSKETVPYASVVVLLSFGKKDSIVGGALTAENGEFSIKDLPLSKLKVRISYVGFKNYERIVALSVPDNVEMDLGNISLETDAKVLGEVEVTGQKTGMQLGLDKKIFNVEKNITATGGTAEDVFKNIPSVSVDADGNALLRNQGTTVFVDGRPTFLALNQIVAEQIDQVEVITNPSAKYDASTTGGIINIITKKNKKPGYNGSVSLGTGLPERWNANANLNIKEGRFNWQASGSYFSSKNDIPTYSNRTNLRNGEILNQFNQNTISGNSRAFLMGRLGTDYTVNNRNTFSIFGNVRGGQFDDNDSQTFVQTLANKDTAFYGTQKPVSSREFMMYSAQMMWRKTFPTKGKELTADVTSNWMKSNSADDWRTNTITNGIAVPTRQVNAGISNGTQITFQVDYTNPINDSTKWEMGIRSNSGGREQGFAADSVFMDGSTKNIVLQSTDLTIIDNVYAAYATYTGKMRGIGYQAGVRYEQSNFNGNSRLSGDGKFGYNYPSKKDGIWNAFFPSLYLSKKVSAQSEVQVNLSRKINRPGFREIMPFIRQTDNQSYSVGNPALKPEFITLAEVNYNHIWKSNNWLISVYYRHESDPIVGFSELDANNLIRTSYINGAGNDRIGLDNTLKLGLTKDIELMLNTNVNNRTIRTDSITRNGWASENKAILSWKLPKGFSTQVTGEYETDEVIAQGIQKGAAFMDFALKKDFGRNASLTFSVNDVFNSRIRVTQLNTPIFLQESMRRREIRNFRLTYQYRFGKMDASIFNRKRSGGQQQQDMDF
jgi:outer membrane cobalamin receptor